MGLPRIVRHACQAASDSTMLPSTLAALPVPGTGERPDGPATEPQGAMLRSRKRISILLAEDDPDLRSMFGDVLEFRGYSVRPTWNGDECLQAAREMRPDLVILDIMMPRRTGIETAAELRLLPNTRTVPILALTALTDPDVHRRALEAGCDLILNKPIVPADLLRGVACLLEESDPTRQAPDVAEEFAMRERTAAAELIRKGGDVIRELSTGVFYPSDTELRQRMQGIQLVPTCASCGRVRMPGGEWRVIPEELRAYFDEWTSVSHGVCPECFAREYPDFPEQAR